MYPAVPWYNLRALHAQMLPEIIHYPNAIIDKSYFVVFFYAMVRGPKSVKTNLEFNAVKKWEQQWLKTGLCLKVVYDVRGEAAYSL